MNPEDLKPRDLIGKEILYDDGVLLRFVKVLDFKHGGKLIDKNTMQDVGQSTKFLVQNTEGGKPFWTIGMKSI